MCSFNVITNITQTIVWQHETLKTLTVVKLHINDRKLNNKNICSTIWKAELLKYIREIMSFLNLFLIYKSKHVIKGAIPDITIPCESNHLGKVWTKYKQEK